MQETYWTSQKIEPSFIFWFKYINWFKEIATFIEEASFIEVKPAGIHLLKVNNKNTKARCEICSKLTRKIPKRLGIVLAPLLLNLNTFNTLF